MEDTVSLFLERQRRSDSRTALYVINGDVDVLDTLVNEAKATDPTRTAEIMDTDSIDTDAVAALYLISHTYRATYLGAIVSHVVRIPHPTVSAVVGSLEAAMEFCQWENVAWLTKRCYHYEEIRRVFEVARMPDSAKELMNVSMHVYNCMPMAWALDKVLSR